MILRLVNNGYLFGKTKTHRNATIKIEYFLSGSYLGTPDELIFTLYPDKFVLGTNDKYNSDKRLYTFFTRLYEQSKGETLVAKSLCHKPVILNEGEIFSIAKKRFKVESELYDYMHKLLKDGWPMQRVMNFHRLYLSKWF